MNGIQELKDKRTKLVIEMEGIQKELPPFEAAIESAEVINQGRESDIRHEISSRKLKIDSINHQIFMLDKKLSRVEALANQQNLMAGYIAEMASWAADELDLNAKRESLSTRLDETQKQAQLEIASARTAETNAATAYAQSVAWGDVKGEKTAQADAQKAANNLATATEQHRRQQLIITALEQEIATIDRHITEAQEEHKKIEKTALHLAHDALEEKWNEAAQALLDVGGKLYAASILINRDAVSLFKLDIPMQGESFGSWNRDDLADRARQYSARNILSV